MTTQSHFYPTRIPLKFTGKDAWIVLDQLRTVDKKRLIKEAGEDRTSNCKSSKIYNKRDVS